MNSLDVLPTAWHHSPVPSLCGNDAAVVIVFKTCYEQDQQSSHATYCSVMNKVHCDLHPTKPLPKIIPSDRAQNRKQNLENLSKLGLYIFEGERAPWAHVTWNQRVAITAEVSVRVSHDAKASWVLSLSQCQKKCWPLLLQSAERSMN